MWSCTKYDGSWCPSDGNWGSSKCFDCSGNHEHCPSTIGKPDGICWWYNLDYSSLSLHFGSCDPKWCDGSRYGKDGGCRDNDQGKQCNNCCSGNKFYFICDPYSADDLAGAQASANSSRVVVSDDYLTST